MLNKYDKRLSFISPGHGAPENFNSWGEVTVSPQYGETLDGKGLNHGSLFPTTKVLLFK